jgi:hypothetical protein
VSALLTRLPATCFKSDTAFIDAVVLYKALGCRAQFEEFAKQTSMDAKTAMELYEHVDVSAQVAILEKTLKRMGNAHMMDYLKFYETKEGVKQAPTAVVATKYLSDGVVLSAEKNYLIKADTGTGKTTLIMNHIKSVADGRTVVIVAPIRSFLFALSRELAAKHIEHSLYVDKQGFYRQGEASVILCSVNSIRKISKLDFKKVVFIGDEFNSVIKYLFSSPIITDEHQKLNRGETVFTFTKMMRECRQLIAMDADLNQICFDFVSLFKTFDYIHSEYKVNKGKTAREYGEYAHLLEAIKQADTADGKFMVCCDEASSAETLYEELCASGVKGIKLFVSEKMTDDDKREFSLDQHPKVIFSPVCIYGVDSVMTRRVFCLYGTYTIDPLMFYQQINRCRNIVGVGFHFKRNWKSDLLCDDHSDFKTAYVDEPLIQSNKCNSDILRIVNEMNDVRLEPYKELFYRYLHQDEIFKVNKKLHFLHILRHKGFNVVIDGTVRDVAKRKTPVKKAEKELDVNDASVENYNKYLHVPKERLEEFKEYFNKDAFTNFIHFKKFYNHTAEDLEEAFKQNSDFTYALVKSKMMATIVTKRLIKETGADIEFLMPKKTLDTEQIQRFYTEMKTCFRMTKVPLNTIDAIQTTLVKAVRSICPDMIVLHKKVNGKRSYKVNMEYVKKSNLLSSFASQVIDETVGYEQRKEFVDEEPEFIDDPKDDDANDTVKKLEIYPAGVVSFD